jgi:hypothetical protein
MINRNSWKGPVLLRRLPVVLLAAGALLAVSGCRKAPEPTAFPTPTPEAQAQISEQRAQMAASGFFYLELRLSDQAIHLCHSGVSLKRYPYQKLEIGNPQVWFFRRHTAKPWLHAAWTDATLAPERDIRRIQIIPGDESTRPTPEVAGIIPPTLEEIIPVPPVYRINFKEGLTVEVLLEGPIPYAVQEISPAQERLQDLKEIFGFTPAAHTQLRATMQAADGAALYRSFPELPEMLVVE